METYRVCCQPREHDSARNRISICGRSARERFWERYVQDTWQNVENRSLTSSRNERKAHKTDVVPISSGYTLRF